MKTIGLAVAAASALSFGATAASATDITYLGHESFDGATVALSITTNGALGVLGGGDIVAWNISIMDGSGSADLISGSSGVFLLGDALTATSTQLDFNFGAVGVNGIVFEQGSIGSGGPLWCVTSFQGACFSGGKDGAIVVSTQDGFSPAEYDVLSGEFVLGSTPEPATWALMLAGFAGLGAALRTRRKLAAV